MAVIGMRMLCREGWIGLLEIDLISVSLFGRVAGDVVMVVSFLWWLVCRGDHGGYVLCCDLNGVVNGRTGLIVVILRSIRVDDLFLFLWVGVGCWVRVIMVCYFMFDCDFLGCICLMRVFVVKRVLWFWTIREIWVIYIVVLIKVMRWLLWVVVILDSWVGVVSCDSWGGFGSVSGWFAYDRDWVRCRGWGFVLVSILSTFVAYVVVDWCSGDGMVGSRWRFVF